MGKFTRWLAVQFYHLLHPQSLQQLRDNHPTHRINGIHHHFQPGFRNSITVHQFQSQHLVDMILCIIFLYNLAQVVHLGIFKILFLSKRQHLCPVVSRQEFPPAVQQFQSIPLLRIMACRQNNTSVRFLGSHGNLRRRRGSQSDIDHIMP